MQISWTPHHVAAAKGLKYVTSCHETCLMAASLGGFMAMVKRCDFGGGLHSDLLPDLAHCCACVGCGQQLAPSSSTHAMQCPAAYQSLY